MMMQPAPGAPMPPPAPQMGMGGMSAPPPQVPENVVTIDKVMRLLRDNAHRRFRIDIETNSTVAGDQAQERQDRSTFIEAITKLIETWGPIIMAKPEMTKLAGELMLFGVRGFDIGRSLEEVIEETIEKLEQQAGIPKPPPQPSPDDLIKLQGIKVKTQAEIAKAQIGVQQAQLEAQARLKEVQLEAQRGAQDHAHTMMQGQQQAALNEQSARQEAAANMMKAEIEQARFDRAIAAANKPPGEAK